MSQQDRQKDQPKRTAFGAMFRTVRLDKANSAASAADQASQIVLNLDQAGKAEELLTGIKETAKLAKGADKLGDSIDKKIEEKGFPVPDQSALEKFLPKPSVTPDTTPDNQDPPPHPAVQIFNIIKTDIHREASEKAGEARQHFLEDRISEGEVAAQSSLDLAKKSREIDPLAAEIVTLITQAGYNDIDPEILTRTAIMIQSESATPPAAVPAEIPAAPAETTTTFILGTPDTDPEPSEEGDFPPAATAQPDPEAKADTWSSEKLTEEILKITGPKRQAPSPARTFDWDNPDVSRPGYMPGLRRSQAPAQPVSEPAAAQPVHEAPEDVEPILPAAKQKPEIRMIPIEPSAPAAALETQSPVAAEAAAQTAVEPAPTAAPAELGPVLGPILPPAPAEAPPSDLAPAKPEDQSRKTAVDLTLDGDQLNYNGKSVELTDEERGILLLLPEESAGLAKGREIAEKLFSGYGTPGSKYNYELAKLREKLKKLTGQDVIRSVLGPKGGISLKDAAVRVPDTASQSTTAPETSANTQPEPAAVLTSANAETSQAPAAAPSTPETPAPTVLPIPETPAPAVPAASPEAAPAPAVETSERAETDISVKDELLVRQLFPFIEREGRYTQSTVRGAVIEVNKAELDAISDPKQRQDREMTLTVQAQSRLRDIAALILDGRTKRKSGNTEGVEYAAALAKWIDSLTYQRYNLYAELGVKGLQGVMSRDYSFDALKEVSIPSQRGRNLGGGNNKGRKGRNLKR